MKKTLVTLSAVLAALMMTACGGGSSLENEIVETVAPDTGTMVYKDAAVQGISFTCGSQKGITDENGTFIFEKGKGCRLTLGGIPLRAVVASELEDKGILWELNIPKARTLQTLDSDNDPSNGITIDEATIATLLSIGLEKVPETDAELLAITTILEDAGFTVVSEPDAEDHILSSRLAGETVYFYQDMGYGNYSPLLAMTFNADLSGYSITANGDTQTVPFLSIEGSRIITGETTFIQIGDITDEYMYASLGTIVDGNETLSDPIKMYFDEAVVPNPEGKGPSEMLASIAGKPLYYAAGANNEILMSQTYNTDFTTRTYMNYNLSDETTVSIGGASGDRITLGVADAGWYMDVLEVTPTTVVIQETEGGETFAPVTYYLNPEYTGVVFPEAPAIDISGLANTPLYHHDGNGIISWTFNDDFTVVTVAGGTGEPTTSTAYGAVDAKIYIDQNIYIEVIEITKDYIVTREGTDENGPVMDDAWILYLSEAAIPIPEIPSGTMIEQISGYFLGEYTADGYQTIFFNSSFTMATIALNGNTTNIVYIDRIEGEKIFFDESSYMQVVEVTDTYVAYQRGVDGMFHDDTILKLYFNKADAPLYEPGTETPVDPTSPLEARSMPFAGYPPTSYYGECVYSDGFATPIAIATFDPLNDSMITTTQWGVGTNDSSTWHTSYREIIDKTGVMLLSFSNKSGAISGYNYGVGSASEITYEWYQLQTSADGSYITGQKTVWAGNTSEFNGDSNLGDQYTCQFTLGLDAETEEDLDAIRASIR